MLTLEVYPSTTVAAVRGMVRQCLDIPTGNPALWRGSRRLEDWRTLLGYGVQTGEELSFSTRPQTQGRAAVPRPGSAARQADSKQVAPTMQVFVTAMTGGGP